MRIIQHLCLLAVVFGVWACDQDTNRINEIVPCCDNPTLMREWRLSEMGWSPGAGYQVTEIPASSNLYLTLRSDGTMESNIDGMVNMKYFQITAENDSTRFMSFYADKSETGTATSRYLIHTDLTKLKLMNTGCIEGCHLGFLPKQ